MSLVATHTAACETPLPDARTQELLQGGAEPPLLEQPCVPRHDLWGNSALLCLKMKEIPPIPTSLRGLLESYVKLHQFLPPQL